MGYTVISMKKRLLVILVVLVVAVAVGIFLTLTWATSPVASQPTGSDRFVVTKGQSITSIGEKLTSAGLIRHPILFRLAVTQQKLGQKIQAGSFLLDPSQNVWQIAQTLTEGTEDVWVTIPEGYRVEEIAETFAKAGLEAFDAEAFILQTKNQEGYLFPDTYLVPKLISTEEIIDLLNRTFEKKVRQDLSEEIASSQYSLEEAMIMASLVQREAGRDEQEMRHIAGVLWNRIAIDQGLGVDATLQYIAGFNQNTGKWWSTPDVSVKTSTSLYNTYKYVGLPPTPIANPGVAAIRSALNPQETDDYYYLHASDGTIHYAKNLAGHSSNIDRYLR